MKPLKWMWVYAVLTVLGLTALVVDAKIVRSRQAIAEFRRQNPCPVDGNLDPSKPCTNHVVDHIMPLCAGGVDEPRNMQWQDKASSKLKDKLEVELCRKLDSSCPARPVKRK